MSRLALLLLALALAALPARATQLVHAPIADLARSADLCVIARVLEERVSWNDARTLLVTTWTLEPLETLAGTVSSGPLTVTRVGGELDGLALSYEGMPELRPGEVAAVFLAERAPGRFVVAGLRLGVLHRRAGRFERSLSGVAGAPAALESWTDAELAAEVRRALAVPVAP